MSTFVNQRIQYNLPKDGKKKDFGVCLKYISCPQDISMKLAEWYETLQAFGVSYIYHPVAEVHPNTAKVLHMCPIYLFDDSFLGIEIL